MKIKQKFEKLREKSTLSRYLVLGGINVILFALLSIPCSNNWGEKGEGIVKIALFLGLFLISFIYGFISVEITDSIIWGNVMFLLFGAVFTGLVGYSILAGTTFGNVLYGLSFFARYAVLAFFVSLVIKNTRNS